MEFMLNKLKNANKPPEFSADAIEVLRRHLWQNIRELKNVLEEPIFVF